MTRNSSHRFLLLTLFVLLSSSQSSECPGMCLRACDDQTQADSAGVVDATTIEELEAQRFGEFTDESVQKECEDWVTKNHWRFGRTLSEIRRNGKGLTADDMLAIIRKSRQQQASQYETLGKDPESVRPMCLEALKQWAQQDVDVPGSPNLQEVGRLAHEAVLAGAKDPVIRSLEALYQPNADPAVVESVLSKLPEELTSAGYGSYFRFLVQRQRLLTANRTNAADRGTIAADLIGEAVSFVEEFSDVKEITPTIWYYLSGLYGQFTENEMQDLYRGLLSSQKADPVILHFYAGMRNYYAAWQARGQGFAGSVNAEAWKEFAERMEKASLHYRKAWVLRPDIPDAAAAMITISNTSSGREAWSPRQWFELGCNARFDHALAYNTYMQPLQPRWGGSHAEMLAFGKECADTKAFETRIPFFLIDYVIQIANETPDSMTWEEPVYVEALSDFWKSFFEWAEQTGLPPANPLVQQQLSFQAAVLIRNSRFVEARPILDQVTLDPASGPMHNVLADPSLSASMAYALSEPDAEQTVEIERRFGRTFERNTAAAEFQTAIEKLAVARAESTSPRGELYFSVREKGLKLQMAFQQGEWVELDFDDPLTMWGIRQGGAKVESPKAMLISNMIAGTIPVQAFSRTAFPPPYTLEATVERIRGNETFEYVGINVLPISQATLFGAPGGMSFMLGDSPRVGGTYVPGRRQVERFPIEGLQDSAEIQVSIWPTSYQMKVNGELLPVPPTGNFQPNSEFSIGGNLHEVDQGEIRIRNVRIRKLEGDGPSE